MITAESTRFFAYVDTTSRENAREKRRALFSVLTGQEFESVRALSDAVGGNSRLQAWIAQALIDGEIVRVNGRLQLPSARPEETRTESERLWEATVRAMWAWVKSYPMDSEEGTRARRATIPIDSFFDEGLDDEDESSQD